MDSDGGNLNLSSDDEANVEPKDKTESGSQQAGVTESVSHVSTLATTKVCQRPSILLSVKSRSLQLQILTPADFAMLNDLRIEEAAKAAEASGTSRAKRKLATLKAGKQSLAQSGQAEDAFISENDILGPRKKAKADYAERVASITKGREGREKFGSIKGKKRKEVPSSSTNREKARNKPIMMILGSGAVKGKKKASLREKQQKLRRHIEHSKKGHH